MLPVGACCAMLVVGVLCLSESSPSWTPCFAKPLALYSLPNALPFHTRPSGV